MSGPGNWSKGGNGGRQYEDRPQTPAWAPLSEKAYTELSKEFGKWDPAQICMIHSDMGGCAQHVHLYKFLYYCAPRNLDPLTNEAHAEFRWDKRSQQYKMAIIVHIDGYRRMGDETGDYDGQSEVFENDEKGKPVACTVTIHRKSAKHPFSTTCYLSEYSTGIGNWQTMPHVMLRKVSEVAAWRIAFPKAMSGSYTADEMDQAGSVVAPAPSAAAIPADNGTSGPDAKLVELPPVPPQPPPNPTAAEIKAEIADLKKRLDSAAISDVLFELGFQNEAEIKTLSAGKKFLAALRDAVAASPHDPPAIDESDIPEGLFPPSTQTHSGVNYPD